MSWSTTDVSTITYGGTDYHFAPTEMVYKGTARQVARQQTQVSESGTVKIQQISTDEDFLYSFTLRGMPAADRTVGSLTIRGYNTLLSLLASSLNFRENVCELAPSGVAYASRFNTRYWSTEIPDVAWVSKQGTDRYGSGESITFRLEIT